MQIDLSQLITAEDKATAALATTRQAARAEARAYLAATDWMVLRAAEGGTPVPEEIATARAQARVKASA